MAQEHTERVQHRRAFFLNLMEPCFCCVIISENGISQLSWLLLLKNNILGIYYIYLKYKPFFFTFNDFISIVWYSLHGYPVVAVGAFLTDVNADFSSHLLYQQCDSNYPHTNRLQYMWPYQQTKFPGRELLSHHVILPYSTSMVFISFSFSGLLRFTYTFSLSGWLRATLGLCEQQRQDIAAQWGSTV